MLSHVSHLPQFLSLSDGDEKRPLALSAIPTEIRQGEEHPVPTVSPLNTLPEVHTTHLLPLLSPLILPTLPVILTANILILISHIHVPLLLPSLLTGEAATTGEVGRCNHGSGALPHTVQRRLWPPTTGPLNRHSQDPRTAAQDTQVSQVRGDLHL